MPDSSRQQERTAPTWVSITAVAWALDEPDVPPHLVSTLVVMARHADPNGRNSHPSIPTIAREIRRCERQAGRNVAALKKLGLLLPGDPAAVDYLPPGNRPEVYDLPIHIRRSGDDVDVRGPEVTPDTGVTPPLTPVTRPPDTDVTPPLTPVSPKEAFKDLEKTNQSSSPTVAPESAVQPEQNPGRKEAEQIIKTQTSGIYGTDLNNLTTAVTDALAQGWPTRVLEAELAKPTTGADSPVAVLIGRIRKLGQPPAPAVEVAKTPCAMHRGQPNLYTCSVCRSKVLVGEDPYAGCEHLRPADWRERFPGADRLKPATPPTVDTPTPDAPIPAQPEPAPKPRPVRRCEHGRVAVNCPTCRTTALGGIEAPASTPQPAPQHRTDPSPCGNPKCVNGQIPVSLNRLNTIPCRECAGTKPTDHKEPLVLGELANAKQTPPRQRPPSRHQLADMLGGLVKTIE